MVFGYLYGNGSFATVVSKNGFESGFQRREKIKIYLKLFIRKKGARCEDKGEGPYASIRAKRGRQGANRLVATFKGYSEHTQAIPGWLSPRETTSVITVA